MRPEEGVLTTRSRALERCSSCSRLSLSSSPGFPSREVYALRDRPENFYMIGSMGLRGDRTGRRPGATEAQVVVLTATATC